MILAYKRIVIQAYVISLKFTQGAIIIGIVRYSAFCNSICVQGTSASWQTRTQFTATILINKMVSSTKHWHETRAALNQRAVFVSLKEKKIRDKLNK
jgi:hypothetical protein